MQVDVNFVPSSNIEGANARIKPNEYRCTLLIDQELHVDATTGAVLHECGHVLATDTGAAMDIADTWLDGKKAYVDLVEDYRIEYGVLAGYFPWCVHYITTGALKVAEARPPELDMPSKIVSVLFKYLNADEAEHEMLVDAKAYFDKWGASILMSKTTAELKDAAIALQELDKKYGKSNEQPETSEGESQRQQQMYGSAQQELDVADDAKAEKLGEEPKNENKYYANEYRHSNRSDEEFRIVNVPGDGFNRVVQHLQSVRNRLHDAIVSEDKGAPQRYRKQGQLDNRRLAYATVTDAVFHQPHAMARKVNTAIDIVSDTSRSMRAEVGGGITRAHISAGTAYTMGVALSRIQGTHVGVMLYGDYCKRVHPIAPMRTVVKETAANWASAWGGTYTEGALSRSMKDLLACRAVKRRICLLITDDEAPEQAQIDACDMLGVEAYVICIDSYSENTNRIKHCNNVNALPGIIAETIKSIMRNSWV